jgi:hypothetical protein
MVPMLAPMLERKSSTSHQHYKEPPAGVTGKLYSFFSITMLRLMRTTNNIPQPSKAQ